MFRRHLSEISEKGLRGSLAAFYNVEKPDNLGPDCTLRFQVQFLFPKEDGAMINEEFRTMTNQWLVKGLE